MTVDKSIVENVHNNFLKSPNYTSNKKNLVTDSDIV